MICLLVAGFEVVCLCSCRSSNSITNDGAATFSSMLQVNKTVKTVHLSSNILANYVPKDLLVVATTDQLVRATVTVHETEAEGSS